MPKLQYGVSNFNRDRGNLPELPVVNMFVEQAPTEDSLVLQSRPGLQNSGTTLGAGPVTSLFQIDGVLGGELYAVSAGTLYKGTVSVGAIAGTGPSRMAGFENRLFINAGSTLYQYDGTTLSTVTVPDSANVTSICVGTSRLILIRKDTGKFYWSNVLDPTVPALSFATAENSPDKLKDCLFIGDTLHLFGSQTVEFWPASAANPNLPYQPMVGRTYSVGIRDTGCATPFATTFAWITNHNQIAVGEPQNLISDAGLDEKIAASTVARLWTFYLDGMEFLAVTLDTETWVFCKNSSQWSTFASNGQTNWIPRCYASDYFGSSIDGRLVTWSTAHADFDGVLERRFRAGTPLTSGTVPVYVVELKANAGRTPYAEPSTYATPEVQLRTSKDGGDTWSVWRTISLGTAGQYRRNLRWTSLGFFGHPGVLMEVRVTDPVPFRVSDLMVNDALATV